MAGAIPVKADVVVAAASPLSPWIPPIIDVSTERLVASVTISDALPQPLTVTAEPAAIGSNQTWRHGSKPWSGDAIL